MNRHRLAMLALAAALFFCSLTPSWSLTVDTPLTDHAQEERAKTLFHEIRCVVCQSESIADSPAEVAADMRRLIREKIAADENEEDIKNYLVERYGDYILMTPPLTQATWLLWFGPLVMLGMGIPLIRTCFRKSRPQLKQET